MYLKLTSYLEGRIHYDTVEFIRGYFNETLTDELVKSHNFRPAFLIDVDVDIYSSAYQVLDWVFKHKIAVVGTYIHYDDWGAPTPEWSGGEALAHKQIADKYSVELIRLGDYDYRKPTWKVKAIGKASEDSLAVGLWLKPGLHQQMYGPRGSPLTKDVWSCHSAIQNMMKADTGSNAKEGDIYEFGVNTGAAMAAMAKLLGPPGVFRGTMWGFDSFQGIPKVDSAELAVKEWGEGAYSAADATGIHVYSKLSSYLKGRIKYDKVEFIRGYFNETLTDELVKSHNFRPAFLIDVDVDIYSSAYQVLDWVFKNKIAVVGTYIHYDDWGAPTPEWSGGEALAHKQIADKYSVECVRLGHYDRVKPTWKVKAIGKAPEDSLEVGH